MSTHSKVRSFMLSNLVNKDNRMVGVEEECILYNEIYNISGGFEQTNLETIKKILKIYNFRYNNE